MQHKDNFTPLITNHVSLSQQRDFPRLPFSLLCQYTVRWSVNGKHKTSHKHNRTNRLRTAAAVTAVSWSSVGTVDFMSKSRNQCVAAFSQTTARPPSAITRKQTV